MPDEKHPDLTALLQRLQAIEERQDRLEAKLGDRKTDKLEPQPPKPTVSPRGTDLKSVPATPQADVKVEGGEDILTALPVDQPASQSSTRGTDLKSVLPTSKGGEPETGRAGEVFPRGTDLKSVLPTPHSLEQAIGLKWAGWIGAIVLAIGAGLGIKF